MPINKVDLMKPTYLASLIGLALISCSQGEPVHPEGDIAEDSRTETTEHDYDARFPVPAWTDIDGRMHFDIDLDEYEFPKNNKVIANIAGKGWKIEVSYRYDIDDFGIIVFKDDDELDVLGCDRNPYFYVHDSQSASIYTHWTLTPDIEEDDYEERNRRYSINTEHYTYDENTGRLHLHFLDWWQVIKSAENEMWLASVTKREGGEVRRAEFIKLVVATPDEVAEWNRTYGAI